MIPTNVDNTRTNRPSIGLVTMATTGVLSPTLMILTTVDNNKTYRTSIGLVTMV